MLEQGTEYEGELVEDHAKFEFLEDDPTFQGVHRIKSRWCSSACLAIV
uniref:Uncharacterized protein n=1 Tax=Arundo donax TaxID=35708 RepID=A0A0A9C0W1_ARUDO